MLSDRKRELEEQLNTIMEENDQLQGIVEELRERELSFNQESCAKEHQVLTSLSKSEIWLNITTYCLFQLKKNIWQCSIISCSSAMCWLHIHIAL